MAEQAAVEGDELCEAGEADQVPEPVTGQDPGDLPVSPHVPLLMPDAHVVSFTTARQILPGLPESRLRPY